MRIDTANLRISATDMPPQLTALIESLKQTTTNEQLAEEMNKIKEWQTLFGKTEMARWAEILNRCDEIFEAGTAADDKCQLAVDTDPAVRSQVMAALHFSALIFENTSSRSIYASMDRLLVLMECSNMRVLIEVLRFLQLMSKRSRFLSSRLNIELQKDLVKRLVAIAECWGGRLRDVKLEQCVQGTLQLPALFPFTFTSQAGQTVQVEQPEASTPLLAVVAQLGTKVDLEEVDRCSLIARLRLLRTFSDPDHRMMSLVARLLAMSTLLYSRCGGDEFSFNTPILPPGFVEETCAVLKLDSTLHPHIDTIKAEALRTLTAVISNDAKPQRLQGVMEHLEAASYHGFLASFTRHCVEELKAGQIGKDGHSSVTLCTALFSLLYHMSSQEQPRTTRSGPHESLVSAGITQTMLSVVACHNMPVELTSFATRCVRVIDIVSSLDVAGFIAHKGMDVCVARLVHEIEECRKEQPFIIDSAADVDGATPPTSVKTPPQKVYCNHQRAALVKSLLNFIKRIINERDFVEQVRHLMEGSLPEALVHIFSNVEYYSASLFHNSMLLVQNFVYQEPAQLTLLQQRHVPFTILMAVLRKEIPPSREIITMMASVFCALCLNENGLKQFKLFSPFEEMIKIILSTKYLHSMKRKKNDMFDCAFSIGTTFDDLLRQHPTLRPLCITALSNTLNRLVALGTEPPPAGTKVVMSLQRNTKLATGQAMGGADVPREDVIVLGEESPLRESSEGVMSPREEEEGESDEEELDGMILADEASREEPEASSSNTVEQSQAPELEQTAPGPDGTRVLPLGDYLCIFGRLVEVLMTSSPPSEMIDSFLAQGCLRKLLDSMRLPHIRTELAASIYPGMVSSILLQHTQRDDVLRELQSWSTESLSAMAELAKREPMGPPLPKKKKAGDEVKRQEEEKAEAKEEEGKPKRKGVSLVAHLSPAQLTELLTDVQNTGLALSGLTKGATTQQMREGDVRAKVITMWADEGLELHSMLHRVYNVLAWEHSVITAMRTSTKVAVQTQTDGEIEGVSIGVEGGVERKDAAAGGGERMEAGSEDVMMAEPGTSNEREAVQVESVAVEPVERFSSAEHAGLTPEEQAFYSKNKDIVKLLYKAYKTVSDLLSFFSRVCIGSSQRSRRAYDNPPFQLSKSAAKLATAVFREYYADFKFIPEGYDRSKPILSYYLTELLGTLSSLIMDDKRHQYHHLLSKFYICGCYHAIFDVLTDYIVPEVSERKMDGPLEALFSEWFKIVTRISSRSGLFQSRYKMTEQQARAFPLTKYYTLVQNDIFDALHSLIPVIEQSDEKSLSTNTRCLEMIYSLLTEVTQNMAVQYEESLTTPVADVPVAPAPEANEADVQRLVEMGYERDLVVRVLLDARGNVNEAIELLMAGADGVRRNEVVLGGIGGAQNFEDLMHRLLFDQAGQEDAVPRGQRGEVAAIPRDMTEENTRTSGEAETKKWSDKTGVRFPVIDELNVTPVKLDWDSVVNRITGDWIPLMLKQMATSGENRTVYFASDLITSVCEYASVEWRKEKMLGGFMREEILKRIAALKLCTSEASARDLGAYLHFCCLVYDAVSKEYLEVLSSGKDMVAPMLELLSFVIYNIELDYLTNAILAPVLLWLELYEKGTRFSRRVSAYEGVDSLTFSYFGYEDRYSGSRGKWVPYGEEISKTLTKALLTGRRSVALKVNRRDVHIDLVDMMQRADANGEKVSVSVTLSEENLKKMDVDAFIREEARAVFSEDHQSKLITHLVKLFGKQRIVSPGAHSAISLLARLTRDEQAAAQFVQEGGVAALLQVRSTQSLHTNALFALVIRQCVEDEDILTRQYEKAVMGMGPGVTPLSSKWNSMYPNSKDWYTCMIHYAGTATRFPAGYLAAAKKLAKIDRNGLLVIPKKEEKKDDKEKEKEKEEGKEGEKKGHKEEEKKKEEKEKKEHKEEKEEKEKAINPSKHAQMIVELLLKEILDGDWTAEENKRCSSTNFRLFPRATLIYVLSELVRSYQCVAILVAEMKMQDGGQGTIVAKLLEKYSDPSIEKDTTRGLHCLLSSVAACNHSPRAQEAVVSDVRLCLQSFLQAPEPPTNCHLKVSEIANALSLMMHSCPTHVLSADRERRAAPLASNHIVRLIVKKRVMNDLMRCATQLVLSKRESIETANIVIRTMDDLAKAINASFGIPPQIVGQAGARGAAAAIANAAANAGAGTAGVRPDGAMRAVIVQPRADGQGIAHLHIDMQLDGDMENVGEVVERTLRNIEGRLQNAMNEVNDVRGEADALQAEIHAEVQENAEDEEAERRSSSSSGSSHGEDVMDEAMHENDELQDVLRDAERNEEGMMDEEEELHSGEDEEEEEDDEEEEEDDEAEEDEEEERAGREELEQALASASAGGEEGERTGGEDDDGEESEMEEDEDDFPVIDERRMDHDMDIIQRLFFDLRGEQGGRHVPLIEDRLREFPMLSDLLEPPIAFDAMPRSAVFVGGDRWPANIANMQRRLEQTEHQLQDAGRQLFALATDPRIPPLTPLHSSQAPSHPLLQRPAQIPWSENTVGGRQGMIVGGGGWPSANYRVQMNRRGAHGLALTRQNAVRRTNPALFIDDVRGGRDDIFSHRHMLAGRPGLMSYTGNTFGPYFDSLYGTDDDRDRQTRYMQQLENCPSFTERARECSRVLDEHHAPLVWALLNSVVYSEATAKDRAEAAAAEAAKKEKAEKEKEEREKRAAESAANEETPAAAEASSEPMDTTDAPSTSDASAPTGETPAAGTVPPVPPSTPAGALSRTATPPAAEAAAPSADAEASRSSDDARMEDSPQSNAATLGGDDQRILDVQEGEEMAPSGAAEVDAPAADGEDAVVDVGGAPEPRARPGFQFVPDEYRDILGVAEIPDGMDAAFLAALPEDMRAEVLRDHERSQRAARATENRPAEVAAASAPGVEPLDQDFLNALPPDLQEEILQQHERAVRAAEQAAAAAAAAAAGGAQAAADGAAAAAVAPVVVGNLEDNPANVIQSLAPGLRAQVLADADDTVLQVLPPELADEARRLRAERGNFIQRTHMMGERGFAPHRIFMGRGGRMAMGRGVGGVGQGASSSGVGQLAGTTQTAPAKGVQVLDRDAFSALIMMFFVDNRLNHVRLQKTLRDLSHHKASCDYLIYALLSILEKTCTPSDDDVVSAAPSWTDTITVSGVGHNERVLRIAKDGSVYIHPLASQSVSRNVLDLLVTIARLFPGHFLPHSLRKDTTRPENGVKQPSPAHFWQTIGGVSSGKGSGGKDTLSEFLVDSLEDSPIAQLMALLKQESVISNTPLHDKFVKVLYAVISTLPDDTLTRLGKEGGDVPLAKELQLVCGLLTSGSCSAEALTEGRLLLVESMRATQFKTTTTVYDRLIGKIEELGKTLQPQIAKLLDEMNALPEPGMASTSSSATALSSQAGPSRERDSDLQRENQRRRTEGERESFVSALHSIKNDQRVPGMSSCAELQVPSVRALTEKGGVQGTLLSSLQTICKVRDTLRALSEERRKKADDEAKKKYEEAKKKFDEEEKKREDERKKKEEEEKKEEGEEMRDEGVEKKEDEDPSSTVEAAEVKGEEEKKEETPVIASTPVEEGEKREPPKPEDFLAEEQMSIPEVKLSERLAALEDLWTVLSSCLQRLGRASDPHAVLALQPAAEAFFLVHAVTPEKAREVQHKESTVEMGQAPPTDEDTAKLLTFAERHRSVLNQVLRANNSSLSDGPFAALALFPKLLDFDVKRTHFRKQLSKMDDRARYRRDDVPLRVRRSHIFSDSFRELFRLRGNEWKSRFYIMFEGEEGQDAGGLLREWFSVITREIFNPNYALFMTAPGDRVTYMINKASYVNTEHLDYFKFVGRIIAKAIHDNKLLDCYFTRAFYKHILNLPVRYQDMESEDPEFYKSLEFLLNNPVETMGIDLTFTLEVEEFGVRSVRPLKEGGDKLVVTDENKEEYVRLVCQMKMTGSIRKQLDAFLQGFYEVIPKHLIAMFNEQELELLISGLPDVDIDDLSANTEYRTYTKNSREIQWFWRALRSYEPEDRAKFLQFVTGTSKVPLNGFASLEGMNGVQKFSVHQDSRGGNRLPAAHTCFNQLDLPVYESYEKLHESLLLAIRECTEGFGFA